MSRTSSTPPTGRAKKKARRKTPANKKTTARKGTSARASAGGPASKKKKTTKRKKNAVARKKTIRPAPDPLAALAAEVDTTLAGASRGAVCERPAAAPGPGLHYAACLDRVLTWSRTVAERLRNWKRAA